MTIARTNTTRKHFNLGALVSQAVRRARRRKSEVWARKGREYAAITGSFLGSTPVYSVTVTDIKETLLVILKDVYNIDIYLRLITSVCVSSKLDPTNGLP